jgi:uncharacterized phiE125 gp8 family phage protein
MWLGRHYYRSSLEQTIEPTDEPIELEDVKAQARVDDDLTDEDFLITQYITAVRMAFETETGRQLIRATYAWRLDCFPPCAFLPLPKPPLLVLGDVLYVDLAGETQTWDSTNYLVDTYATPGRLVLAPGAAWPSTQDIPNAVTICFEAGYGETAEDVPMPIRQCLLLWAAELYRHREPTGDRVQIPMPYAIERLMYPYMVAGALVG